MCTCKLQKFDCAKTNYFTAQMIYADFFKCILFFFHPRYKTGFRNMVFPVIAVPVIAYYAAGFVAGVAAGGGIVNYYYMKKEEEKDNSDKKK